MNITVPAQLNPVAVVKRAGYGLVRDGSPQTSYARRFGGGFYPRFHIYINGSEIGLHLDQKQTSYQGQKKHSGEYDGETVIAEIERLKQLMQIMLTDQVGSQPTSGLTDNPGKKIWQFWKK
ncbi:MAG TPA: hypothetical protein PK619_03335 [bacterium]|nr:hypothetical protein [bacterium]HPW39721.1 hypothetical protein [bacterium]